MGNKETLERELRQKKSALRMFGTGMLAFTAWLIIKTLLATVLIPEAASDSLFADVEDEYDWIFTLVMIVLIVLIVWMRLHIGFAARAEGLGKRRGRSYVIMAFVFFAVQIATLIGSLQELIETPMSDAFLLDTAASLLLELCSTSTTGQLAFTAVRVRRLDRQLHTTV